MQFLYVLERIRTPFLDSFLSLITHLGSETLFLAIALVVYWCVSKKQGYYLMTVGFWGTLVNQFLKLICQIPRPWVKDPEFTIVESARAGADGYSSPAGIRRMWCRFWAARRAAPDGWVCGLSASC